MPDPSDIVVTQDGRVLVGTAEERARGFDQLTSGGGAPGSVDAAVAEARALAAGVTRNPTPADAVAVGGLGLVTWWALGGPAWAGVASVVVNEFAVPYARSKYTASTFGYRLDWAGLYTTTPLAVYRAVANEGGGLAMTAAVSAPVLLTQYLLAGTSWHWMASAPRSAITLGAIVRRWWKGR